MGHKMGHFENLFLIIYLISINYISLRVRPSHHRNINRRQRTSFFVPEIQYPQGFPRFFTQPKST
ncbi:hypothetical protein BDE27_2912 [Xenorhabdus ehlersii]|uniref:Uncharacterized protein n=1 Tax=Xenorhabdus ehlersii TaxID=290111 RepID=A0A2D0IMW4_9GAMM|nr:hypothetical protein Xehl_02939 [Xenorhabdus ehlersii]RKE89281.1 hypothetical protein BDE27_2912 [Xenorhabdus ehlersii]